MLVVATPIVCSRLHGERAPRDEVGVGVKWVQVANQQVARGSAGGEKTNTRPRVCSRRETELEVSCLVSLAASNILLAA